MLRMFKRKYKAVMMAWVMLLSFLPQVLVKGFHQHRRSLDKVECNFVAQSSQRSTSLENGKNARAKAVNARAKDKQHEKHRKDLAQHQKKSSDDGQGDKEKGHDCAICHYLISPFTPPSFTAFSFYAPSVLVVYQQQADDVRTVAVTTPQLRGPPQA